MQKILNDPRHYVDDTLRGLCAAHPQYYHQRGDNGRVIARPDAPVQGKVGLACLGGSGHLPLFTGYVGKGLLDACAIGDVFASPSCEQYSDAIRAANGGKGVLCIYGNYGGDVMNAEMASEMLEMEDIETRHALGADDVASASPEEREKRRGVAGLIYGYKTAGAKAETGASLDEVAEVAQKTLDNVRTVGVALSPCTVPAAGKPNFTVDDGTMEIGMGIHGEPGVQHGPLKTADEITDQMMQMLQDDRPVGKGDRVAVMVNSLGATPLEELYIVYARVAKTLGDLGATIVMPWVGRYATSMEMAGMSISILKLDDKLEALLKAPCDCAYLRVE